MFYNNELVLRKHLLNTILRSTKLNKQAPGAQRYWKNSKASEQTGCLHLTEEKTESSAVPLARTAPLCLAPSFVFRDSLHLILRENFRTQRIFICMAAVVATVSWSVSRPPLQKKHLLRYYAWDAHRCRETEYVFSTHGQREAGSAKTWPMDMSIFPYKMKWRISVNCWMFCISNLVNRMWQSRSAQSLEQSEHSVNAGWVRARIQKVSSFENTLNI